MAQVTFYEKPGCQANARQRILLEQAGHAVERRDLLAERWTAQKLLAFFGEQPVSQWFNRASPRVKSGEILPAALRSADAIELMLDDPLLIRRPLIEAGGWRIAGFDAGAVDRAIGLKVEAGEEEDDRPLEGCAHVDTGRTCPSPA